MAIFDAFLKLDGIKGENADGSISLESFSWGVSNAIGSATGGAGSGKASFQDLSFKSMAGMEAPDLFTACANGKHIPTGQLTISHKQTPLLTITFSDVFISSYKIDQMTIKLTNAEEPNSSLGGSPMNNVSFNFLKYVFQTRGSSSSGNTTGNPT
jgi:type VI secretion system secreted protein Hcp